MSANKLKLISAAVLIAASVLLKKQRKRKVKRLWSKDWLLRRDQGRGVGHLLFKELKLEDEKVFKTFTRMSSQTFNFLLEKVGLKIIRKNIHLRKSIPACTRLLVTFRFLATGESYRSLSYSFRISIQAIAAIIPETVEIIYTTLASDYLKAPCTKEQWTGIANEFSRQWNFPFCLGSLDGKHIAFRAPRKDGSFYFNYKGFHSIVLVALVDANYKFLYVDVGRNGRISDGGVFANSSLYTAINKNSLNFPDEDFLPGTNLKLPYVIVMDEAFKRRVVENAFGIISNRFRILQTEINLSVKKVENIVLTCCVLHNFIKEIEEEDSVDVDNENTKDVSFTPGLWRQHINLTKLERSTYNRATNRAMDIRNNFCKYFNTTGFVNWQWEAIKKFNF